jgi:hypothetical protein
MSFNMTFNTDALANWAIVGEYWANLWKTPVLGYEEMTQVIATKHASGSSVD